MRVFTATLLLSLCLGWESQPVRCQALVPGQPPGGVKANGASRSASPSSVRAAAEREYLAVLAQFFQSKNIAATKLGFLNVLKLDPSYPQPRYNLGVLAEAENNKPEAIKWFSEYLQFDHTSRYARAARIKLRQLQHGPLDPRVLTDKQRQYDAHLSRARVFIRVGLFKEAVAEFDEAARLDETRWEAFALTAVVLTQQGLLAEARQFEEKAKQRTPSDQQKALAAVLQTDAREAEYRELSRAAVNAFQRGDYLKAAEGFSRAWQMFPARSDPGFAAAVAFTAAKDYIEAVIVLSRLKTNPDVLVSQKARRMLDSITAKK